MSFVKYTAITPVVEIDSRGELAFSEDSLFGLLLHLHKKNQGCESDVSDVSDV